MVVGTVILYSGGSGADSGSLRGFANLCPWGRRGMSKEVGRCVRPSHHARGCWVVPTEALGSLGMELSQGSSLPSLSILVLLFHRPRLPHPASGKTPCFQDAGMGRRAGRGSAEIAAPPRAGIPAGFAPVRSGPGASAAGTPARCRALLPPPPLPAPSAPLPSPPTPASSGPSAVKAPQARPASSRSPPPLGVRRCPGGGLRGARGGEEPGPESAGRAGTEDARGRPGGARFPLPRGPSASRRDVTGRPPAPRSSGQSACGRRAHGLAGRAGSGRPGPGRAARGRAQGRAPTSPGPPSGFPRGEDVGNPGDLPRHSGIHLPVS